MIHRGPGALQISDTRAKDVPKIVARRDGELKGVVSLNRDGVSRVWRGRVSDLMRDVVRLTGQLCMVQL